jgi:hypothetical protein
MCFIAFAQSSAVVTSSNTNVNVGDESRRSNEEPRTVGKTLLKGDALYRAYDPGHVCLSYVLVAARLRDPDDRIVAKLRGARERKRGTGKCEGRKSHAERNPVGTVTTVQ